VLLVGGSGQLGTAITQTWSDCEIAAPPHDALRLEDSAAVERSLREVKADVLVNAAAFADVDRCEIESDRAMEINAYAVGRTAEIALRAGAVFITLSTDYVFDGRKAAPYTEDDVPNPLSAYGRSKLEGERLVAASGARAFVVRTCGVYGPSRSAGGRRAFLDRVLGGNGEPIRVVNDVVVSPTFAGDLALALRRLLDTRRYGLYHAVNSGAVSWYDFAVEAAFQAGAKVAVEPISVAQWKARALRPAYSALDQTKLRSLGIAPPSWKEGIAAYLRVRALKA
jgi:dTDP-4-dehydrorhamnose reductase